MNDVLYPHDSWRKTPCWRCGRYHPKHCPDCYNPGDLPACRDHVCSWPDDDEDD